MTRTSILFDIDGTLLYAKGLGRPAFADAFEVAYGKRYDKFDEISFVGATDSGIIRKMSNHLGIPSTTACEERFYIELTKRLDPKLEKGPIQIYKGVQDLLKSLSSNFLLGTVTGNIRSTAWSKLHFSGLAEYFSFGAYSDDCENRNDIATLAMKRAEKLGSTAKLLIGDTFKDIEAAHANGLPALAVATGWISADDLQKAGADAVLPDFSDIDKTISTINELVGEK